MKTIEIENASVNLGMLIKYVNEKREPIKIISNNGEAVIVDVQNWGCLEKLLEDVEKIILLESAQKRKGSHSTLFKDFISEEELDFDEIGKL